MSDFHSKNIKHGLFQKLGLSDGRFKIIIINMLEALMGKEYRMQNQTGQFSRDGNYKNESNGIARNQNTVNKNKERFNGLIYRFDVDKERIHKLKDRVI